MHICACKYSAGHTTAYMPILRPLFFTFVPQIMPKSLEIYQSVSRFGGLACMNSPNMKQHNCSLFATSFSLILSVDW